ncbi:FKBP-type peptidyl-prolyl cis-trans isomerase SlyD [Luteibacter sp. Sphag1AF]|uniref:FKBP-type peptidyl-prolyl cis-trans isomerase n=1 Tax=Luteibacter sp. Sphag1AF TaxID=2587031 RepID=UPI0016189FAA|nr:peptidylprolyl isomerase [Luteibacter sp. Sphag1AF]MBB3227223.1 FKBP-type peptidyl-prolyl cis-trans isomerase SlyD [Luteibacter sp. Sphag1AF]
MQAGKDKVISFHYTLGVDGNQVESSKDAGEPLWILLGHGQLIPGLEAGLEGKSAGDSFDVEITPEQGYGPRQEGMTQRVPKKFFQNGAKLKVGDSTVLSLKEGGQRVVVVQKVGMSVIDVDLNHPMAGKTLNFHVDVVSVRDASEEEVQHGHAHPGEDGKAAH